MDNTSYKAWHSLHVQVARGEELAEADRAAYEAGLKQMEDEEHLQIDFGSLREIRVRIRDLEAENRRLRSDRQRRDRQITELEARLSERERRLLGVGER